MYMQQQESDMGCASGIGYPKEYNFHAHVHIIIPSRNLPPTHLLHNTTLTHQLSWLQYDVQTAGEHWYLSREQLKSQSS